MEKLTLSFLRINSQLIGLFFASNDITSPHINVQIRRVWANLLGVTQDVLEIAELLRCKAKTSILCVAPRCLVRDDRSTGRDPRADAEELILIEAQEKHGTWLSDRIFRSSWLRFDAVRPAEGSATKPHYDFLTRGYRGCI